MSYADSDPAVAAPREFPTERPRPCIHAGNPEICVAVFISDGTAFAPWWRQCPCLSDRGRLAIVHGVSWRLIGIDSAAGMRWWNAVYEGDFHSVWWIVSDVCAQQGQIV